MRKNQKYTIYTKGSHQIKVLEHGRLGTIEGLGSVDSIDLMILLLEDGYTITSTNYFNQ